jgi:hypothetical protein
MDIMSRRAMPRLGGMIVTVLVGLAGAYPSIHMRKRSRYGARVNKLGSSPGARSHSAAW